MSSLHPIRAVARRTGLSVHLIRMWERRYQAVTPQRSDTRRRCYSDADIERLRLLRLAVQQGESIGQISQLSNDELLALIESAATASSRRPLSRREVATDADPASLINRTEGAILAFDANELGRVLLDADVALSRPMLLEHFLAPLLKHLGEKWEDGTLRVAHEHFACAAIRTFLGKLLNTHPVQASSPWIICATSSGQLHELGAMFAALTAASGGWNIAYLGPSVPAEEIAFAMKKCGSSVAAISIVYPTDDPNFGDEMLRLRQLTGEQAILITGGSGAESYREQLSSAQMEKIESLTELSAALARLRKQRLADNPGDIHTS